MPAIRFGREICGDLDQAQRREWWLANGRGAYAGGTVAGSVTRRYHGLLIAPVDPPLGRTLVVAKADASLVLGDRSWPLFTNVWGGGTVDPQGYLHIESFVLDGTIPSWRFAIGDLRIEGRIWMEHGADTTYVAWRLESPVGMPGGPVPTLQVRILANQRDHHGSTGGFEPEIGGGGDRLQIVEPGRFTLTIGAAGGTIVPERQWIGNFDLAIERERGLPTRDDHLSVGVAELHPVAGRWVGLALSLEDRPSVDLGAALGRRQARDRGLLAPRGGVGHAVARPRPGVGAAARAGSRLLPVRAALA